MTKVFKKRFTTLLLNLLVGLLFLFPWACDPDGDDELETPGTSQFGQSGKEVKKVDPDKFGVELHSENRPSSTKNFVVVEITPGSAGMELKDFYVTAFVEDDTGALMQGKLTGAKIKPDGKYGYDLVIGKDRGTSLIEMRLWDSPPRSGEDDTAFKEGKPVLFKLCYDPPVGIKKGTPYTLTVTIERQGDYPHTETGTEVLQAPRDILEAKDDGREQKRKQQEREQKKKQQEEEKIKKQQEEEKIKKQQEEEKIKKQQEEEKIKKQQEEEKIKKQQEEEKIKKQEKKPKKKKQQEKEA